MINCEQLCHSFVFFHRRRRLVLKDSKNGTNGEAEMLAAKVEVSCVSLKYKHNPQYMCAVLSYVQVILLNLLF